MSEEIFTKEFNTVEEMGWKELNELAEEAREIIDMLGAGPNKDLIEKMIIAVPNKDLGALKYLAYEAKIFPYRENIRQALKLLVTAG